MKNFLFQVKKKVKKKRSRSNDFGSDEYSYSILYSDPRISEYSDTRSSPNDQSLRPGLDQMIPGHFAPKPFPSPSCFASDRYAGMTSSCPEYSSKLTLISFFGSVSTVCKRQKSLLIELNLF